MTHHQNGNGSVNGSANGSGDHLPGTAPFLRTNGASAAGPHRVLITGGAGFVGTNIAAACARRGSRVTVYDNLSRPGVESNLGWLVRTYAGQIDVLVDDVRDAETLQQAVAQADVVFHFAAQVAVTTSFDDPLADFEINARGTLNLLEACRQCSTPPVLLFTSTNKVYGDLEGVALKKEGRRHVPVRKALEEHGLSEATPLNFHSPYGCSKGTADQYVLDYARSFNLPACVFRMSCIYGPQQHGTEDQGWVAHFIRQTLRGEPITIYGDGCQVRDVLYVEDLVRAMFAAVDQIDRTKGQAFNIGGGVDRSISLLELIDLIGDVHRRPPEVELGDWRPGDQKYYVSDVRRFQDMTGWQPRVTVANGVRRLYAWLTEREARPASARGAKSNPRAATAAG
jgi:CDP-paratose 2-epimerase